jgi:putative spermidine/putrescine transport system permease protein
MTRLPAFLGALRRDMPWPLLAAPLLFFAAFFAFPLAVVLVASATAADGSGLTLAHYARVLLDAYHWDILWLTLRIAFVTTAIAMMLGYPLAYYLVRVVEARWLRRACVVLLVIPLFTSNIVRSFGWMVLLGRVGIVNETLQGAGLIERPIRFLGSETGIVIGLVYILLPFVVLTTGNAIAAIDRRLEEAASDLGAGPAQRFRTIVWPLSLPGLLSGAVIVFTLAVSAYVTPALLSSGRVTVFSMLIYQQYASVFDFHYGGALSVVLLVATLLLLWAAAAIDPTRRRT